MNRIGAYLKKESRNQWAAGCDKCQYGIVAAPELTGACELYLERLVQALAKEIVFCDCQAGTRYRAFLLNRRQKLIEEAKCHPLMVDYAKRGTHLDIEVARIVITNSYTMGAMPTIHMAGETA